MKTPNDRPPNFRDEKGNLFLVRCFVCEPERGTENYIPAVATGICARCGWEEPEPEQLPTTDPKSNEQLTQ